MGMERIGFSIIASVIALLLTGCSAGRVVPETEISQSGVISITRLAPQTVGNTVMLGFIPVAQESDKPRLSIDTTKGTLSLVKGDELLSSCSIDGAMKIKPGSYQIEHKQRSPLWYAEDSYFTNRGLPVPAPEHKDRYRRGALGEFALFLDKDNAIHSSEVWTDEVGGLRIADEDIRKIYYSLDVGSVIEVR